MAKVYAIGIGSQAYPIPAKSERGAKNAATRRAADSVGYISTISNMYIETHTFHNGRWKPV